MLWNDVWGIRDTKGDKNGIAMSLTRQNQKWGGKGLPMDNKLMMGLGVLIIMVDVGVLCYFWGHG
jgi:hypothetical protein